MNGNLARSARAELDLLSDRLHLPAIVKKEAKSLYAKALGKELAATRGEFMEAWIAAAVYLACIIAEIPRTLKDIAEASLVEKKNIARCYRLLVKTLDIQVPVPPKPQAYVSIISTKASISYKSQRRAVEILNKEMQRRAFPRRYPPSLAAAALYLACTDNDEPKTQEEIAEAAGLTDVTVRKSIKYFKERPREFKQSLGEDVYNKLQKIASSKGMTVQKLIRAVIVDDWLKEIEKSEQPS